MSVLGLSGVLLTFTGLVFAVCAVRAGRKAVRHSRSSPPAVTNMLSARAFMFTAFAALFVVLGCSASALSVLH